LRTELTGAIRERRKTRGDLGPAGDRLLLTENRREAGLRVTLTANVSSTGLATSRAIVRKYPDRDRRTILLDLAASSGDPGRWFAAAKNSGFLDLALESANTGRTDPRTLSRAARDLLKKDPRFCLKVGRLAIQRILEGYGYELTGDDVIDAYENFLAAADKLGVAAHARNDGLAIATRARQNGGPFSDTLIRHCTKMIAAPPPLAGCPDG
jgi:hypothetical protein